MPSWSELLLRQQSRKIYTAEPTLARPDGQGGVETKTLRLSTHALHPRRAALYHEPRLKGVPYFQQSIQESFLGRSQVGYGRLEILNGDRAMDGDVTGWHWAGQPVVIKLGFEELDAGEFQPVLTGRLGAPAFEDRVISVPLQDYQIDLARAELAEGDYSDTVPNLVAACLTAAGVTAKDQGLWDAWAAANGFAGFVHSAGEPVSSILDRILAPLACWYGFDRAGSFIIGNLEPPDAGTPDLDLAGPVDCLLDFRGKEWSKHFWKVVVEYITATSPLTHGGVSREDSSIPALNPSAEQARRRTVLTAQADANTIRDRWWDLFSVRRRVLPVTAKVQPASLRLHGQVKLARDRYSIAQNYRVVGLKDEFAKNRVSMELFA